MRKFFLDDIIQILRLSGLLNAIKWEKGASPAKFITCLLLWRHDVFFLRVMDVWTQDLISE